MPHYLLQRGIILLSSCSENYDLTAHCATCQEKKIRSCWLCCFWLINVWMSLLGVRRESFWPVHNQRQWKCLSKCYNWLRMVRGASTGITSQNWVQTWRPSVTIFPPGNWSAIFNKKMVAVAIGKEIWLLNFIEQITWRFEWHHYNCWVFLLLDWPRPMLKELWVNKPIHKWFLTNDSEA